MKEHPFDFLNTPSTPNGEAVYYGFREYDKQFYWFTRINGKGLQCYWYGINKGWKEYYGDVPNLILLVPSKVIPNTSKK